MTLCTPRCSVPAPPSPALLQTPQLLRAWPWGPPSHPGLPLSSDPRPQDRPEEGAGCRQHTLGPPRSSPAQAAADKLPDRLQRLALTGVRLDPAVCVHSTHPTKKTGLRLLPHWGPPRTAPPATFRLPGQSTLGRGSALPLAGRQSPAPPLHRPCPAQLPHPVHTCVFSVTRFTLAPGGP